METSTSKTLLQKHGIRRIAKPTKDQIRDAYHRADTNELQDQWELHRKGQLCWHPWDTYSPSNLEIVRTSDIRVYHKNSVPCNCGHDLAVERLSRPSSIFDFGNYAGYDSKEGCYAFRGQRRLLGDFLSKTEPLFENSSVKSAFVRPVGVSIPFAGFPAEWTFEEFAVHAETMVCILFLESGDKDPLGFEAMAPAVEERPDSDKELDFLHKMAKSQSDTQDTAAVEAAETLKGDADDPVKPGRYAFRQRKSAVYR
ncbi:hypothetical protein ED733_003422 [Metarhizium rileyi]|nr:hypothetical protein ED733_003422 [Metarhizium rileyi]